MTDAVTGDVLGLGEGEGGSGGRKVERTAAPAAGTTTMTTAPLPLHDFPQLISLFGGG